VRLKEVRRNRRRLQGEERTGGSGRGRQGRGTTTTTTPRREGAGRAGDRRGERGAVRGDGARSHQELGEHGLVQLGHVDRLRVAQNEIDTRFLWEDGGDV
jgi:hypothetical protein